MRGLSLSFSKQEIVAFAAVLGVVFSLFLLSTPHASAATTSDNRRVLIWDDLHVGNNEGDGYSDDFENAVNAIINLNPDLGFCPGDVTEAGSENAWTIAKENFRYIANNTDIEKMYYAVGLGHDGAQSGDSGAFNTKFSVKNGWSYAEEVMLEDNRTAYHYAVTDGNMAYIVLSQKTCFNDNGYEVQAYTLSPHVQDWLDNRLTYFESENYNIIVMSHTPPYHTNNSTGDWSGMDDSWWQTISDNLIDIMNEHPPDVFVNAHVHSDSDSYHSTESGVAGGKVVWGDNYNASFNRSPALPDNTVFVSMPTVCYEHGHLAGTLDSNVPEIAYLDFSNGDNYVELYAENVINENLLGWTDNDSDANENSVLNTSPLKIDVEHPIELDSDGVDNFYQPWCVSDYSKTAFPEHWWNKRGLVQDENRWFISRWKFNENKSFDSLSVDWNHKGYIEHKFWSGDNLSSWSGPYDDPSKAPPGRYWKVKTNLHPSSDLEIYDMSLRPEQILNATTEVAENIGLHSAKLTGGVEDMGDASSVDVKLQYRPKGSATWENTPKRTLDNLISFTENVAGLDDMTTYEWRAWADNGTVENTGVIKEFRTPGWRVHSSASENDSRVTISNGRLRLSENLVAYWSMDEFPDGFGSTDNTVYDLTSYNNNGTAENGPAIAAGKWDNALDFDGADDYVDIPDFSEFSAYTLCFWSYHRSVNDGNNDQVISILKNNNIVAYDNGSGYMVLRHKEGDGTFHWLKAPVSNGEWNFWTLTWDGWNLKAYKNGNLYDNVAGIYEWTPAGDPDLLGWAEGYNVYFDGKLDEVRIYNRALSEDEIRRIYSRTKPSSVTGDDLKTGKWSSTTWKHDAKQGLDNVELSSTVGTGENLWANLTVYDDDGSQVDNTGWENVERVSAWGPAVENGYQYSLDFRLQTENTSHSPSVVNFEVNSDPDDTALAVENISANLELVDKTNSTPLFDENGSVIVTSRVRDNNGKADLRPIDFGIRDGGDAEVVRENISENTAIDENTLKFTRTYNPPSSVEEGLFDIFNREVDSGGATCIENYQELGENLFAVTDLNTTLNISDTTPAKGDTITISGTASRAFGTVSLDNVMVEINGKLHQAGFHENGSWSYRHTVRAPKGSEVDVKVHLLDRGSSVDGTSSTWTFAVQEAPGGAPIAPAKPQPMRMEVSVGKLKGGTFVPSERVGIGQIATVRIKLTSKGEPVEGADVGAWWIPRPTQAKTETIGISEVGGGVYQGSFSISEDVTPGTYEVSASAEKPGYEKAIGYDTFHVGRRVARPGPAQRAVGWMRKHPAVVAVAIIALLLLILIVRE